MFFKMINSFSKLFIPIKYVIIKQISVYFYFLIFIVLIQNHNQKDLYYSHVSIKLWIYLIFYNYK